MREYTIRIRADETYILEADDNEEATDMAYDRFIDNQDFEVEIEHISGLIDPDDDEDEDDTDEEVLDRYDTT